MFVKKKNENILESRGKTLSSSTCENSIQKKKESGDFLKFSVVKPKQDSQVEKKITHKVNKSFYTSESNIFKLSKNMKNCTFSEKKTKNDNDKITANSALVLNETISYNRKNLESHLPIKKFTHMKDQFSNRSFYQ